MRSVRGTAPNDRPLLGKTLRNTHRLVELLDRGDMGSVCVAEHQRLDRKLALKVSRSTSRTMCTRSRAFIEKRLGLGAVVRIVQQLVQALAAAHRAQVVGTRSP